MFNRPRFISLRTKLALAFALVSMLAVGLTTYIYYQNTKNQLRADIRERLLNSVAIAALHLDAESHALLTEPSQEGNATYLELKKDLQNIRDSGTNIEFVYSMRPDEQNVLRFIVDAEESEEDISHLGDPYPDAGPVLAANYLTMTEPMLEDDFYTDEWGTHLSGYAPFYSSDGRREGILGMDISANTVIALEQQALRRAVIIFSIFFVSLTIIGWLLGVALSSPITKLTEAAAKLSSGDLANRVHIRSGDEISILGDAFNTTAERLNSLVSDLEQRVAERTTALSHRTSQLQAATTVARSAAAIKDPAALLNDAVRLISEQFGFYHTGIFLLDENSEYAILQAASSEGGQRMLERGYRLQVGGAGVVGFVAAQKRSRTALDTGLDAVTFDNPDLPRTRSQAALPLVARERVIGVLDIQSEIPQAFSPEDIETFQTLADQLALAIENARLFNEMESAVKQMSETNTRRVRGTWGEISRAKASAYQYTPLGIQSIPKQDALDSEDGKLRIPINLHNIKIGEIRVRQKDGSDRWSPREQAMLEEIAAQVGLALENARLLSNAQQRAARERSIGEIAARIGAAHDIDAILRVTAQEIGKAINDSEIIVQIRPEELEAK